MKNYEARQEFFNAISHWLGVIIGFVCLFFLVSSATKDASNNKMISFLVYGISFICMYLASALYHSVRDKKIKGILRVFDHASIFLFIAGSYTPIALLSFEGSLRIATMVLVWSLAGFGIVFKIFTYGKFEKTNKISLALYLVLGWISLFMLKAIVESTSPAFIISLVLGGVFYSFGTVFYSNKRIPYNHLIWHVFVLVGSLVHYGGLYRLYG